MPQGIGLKYDNTLWEEKEHFPIHIARKPTAEEDQGAMNKEVVNRTTIAHPEVDISPTNQPLGDFVKLQAKSVPKEFTLFSPSHKKNKNMKKKNPHQNLPEEGVLKLANHL